MADAHTERCMGAAGSRREQHRCRWSAVCRAVRGATAEARLRRRALQREVYAAPSNLNSGLCISPQSGGPAALRQALAKWPPNPRAYLFGARAASAVRTLFVPALGDAASCPPCLGCPWVSSRSPLHARGALQGRPRGRALASTCMSWQLDAADAGSARPTAHPAERV